MATEVMNGVHGHDDVAAGAAGSEKLPNGDVPHIDSIEQTESLPADRADQKGLLGAAPPAPPTGDIPDFGDVPLVSQPQKAVEKAPQSYDFWFVRVPRPDVSAEQNRIKVIQMTIAEKKEKQNFISAALRLKQAARSEAQAALRGARDRARECSAEVRKKFDEAKPLQDALKRLNEGRKDARAQGRDLQATSEAELDALIASKEHRMLHDSITLNEEKQLMKEMKMLEASRPKVREMQALYATVNESMGQKDGIQAQLKPLLAEAELLKVERDAAQEICKTFEAEAEVCEKAVQDLLGERSACIQEQDVLYEELRALKAEAYKKEEEFRQNRRDFAQVQQLAATKNIAELEKFCQEQRERMHAKLNKDSAYRKSYVTANQWSTIRRFGTPDTRRLGVDEDPATILDSASAKSSAQAIDSREPRSGAPKTERRSKGGDDAPKAEKPKAAPKAAAKPAAAEKIEKPGKAEKAETVLVSTPAAASAPAKSTEEIEKEKEERRQEALAKAKEAEERKRKQAERAQQRAEARAAKEAEEAALKKQKEKERKARKKAAEVAAKEAAAAAAKEAAGEQGEEAGEDYSGEGAEAPDGSSAKKGKKSKDATENLTKRQRKRLAHSKKGDGEAGLVETTRKGGKGESAVFLYAAGAAVVIVVLLIIFLGAQMLQAPAKPVFAE